VDGADYPRMLRILHPQQQPGGTKVGETRAGQKHENQKDKDEENCESGSEPATLLLRIESRILEFTTW
jgi:hypothetical protein